MFRRFALTLLLLSVADIAAASGTHVYVWDFATRDLVRNSLTSKFTHDFEAALVEHAQNAFVVLERRNLANLVAQVDNEKAVGDILQISDSTLENLKAKQADQVIFGEVFDDVESGQVHITVTFQSFDGTKSLIKSVLMSRGLVNDATSRKDAMVQLVKELSIRTARKARVQAYGFIFDFKACEMFERNIICRVSITNNGEDRVLRICRDYNSNSCRNERGSRMFDDFSAETTTSKIQLGSAGGSGHVESMLISGRPAEAVLHFNGVSSKATTVTRLDLVCWERETETSFVATFRNIVLQK